MATYVETGDLKIMIDPGVALSPDRFSLPPHPVEERRKNDAWELIKLRLEEADLVIITHFHRDHFNPDHPEVFDGKFVYLKDYDHNINYHQKLRAEDLINKISTRVKRLEVAEGKILSLGDTEIHFSPPLPHGGSEKLGFVVSLSIKSDETFLFTSDVQGLVRPEHIDFILNENPDIIYLDGPNTPMLGYQFFDEDLKTSIENISRLTGLSRRIIVDHHLLRDPEWRSRLGSISSRVETAAHFMGKAEELLEANRRELYKDQPVENVEKLRKFVE